MAFGSSALVSGSNSYGSEKVTLRICAGGECLAGRSAVVIVIVQAVASAAAGQLADVIRCRNNACAHILEVGGAEGQSNGQVSGVGGRADAIGDDQPKVVSTRNHSGCVDRQIRACRSGNIRQSAAAAAVGQPLIIKSPAT